jgi:hydroxyacylglutathione hydrolase
MKVETLILGDYETNSYILTADDVTKDCLIIDTGLDPEPLIDYLKSNNLVPAAVILTHGHADHIMGVNVLRENWSDIKVAIHKADAEMLARPTRNLSLLAGSAFKTEPADILIDEEGPIEFAALKFDILHTPGHSPGGICLYSKEHGVAFVGDTLFASSIGRTDLHGGDFNTLIASIKQKLLTLPPETRVYTGHGPATTIEVEMRTNQYLV